MNNVSLIAYSYSLGRNITRSDSDSAGIAIDPQYAFINDTYFQGIDHVQASTYPTRQHINNVSFIDCPKNGEQGVLHVASCNYVTVSNLTINGTRGCGLNIDSTHNFTLDGASIKRCGSYLDWDTVDGDGDGDNGGGGPTAENGISIYSSDDNNPNYYTTIRNTYINDTSYGAISLEGSGDVAYVQLYNITASYSAHNTIDMHGGRYHYIDGLTASHGMQQDAILECSSSSIYKNLTLSNDQGDCFGIDNPRPDGSIGAYNNTYENVSIAGEGKGLSILASEDNTFINVTSTNLWNNNPEQSEGVYYSYSTYNDITCYPTHNAIVDLNSANWMRYDNGVGNVFVNAKWSYLTMDDGDYYTYYYPNIVVKDTSGNPISGATITFNTTVRNGRGKTQTTFYTDVNGKLHDSGNRTNWAAIPYQHVVNSGTTTTYKTLITASKSGKTTSTAVTPATTWYSANHNSLSGTLYTLTLDTQGTPTPPDADFTANRTSGSVTLAIAFTDTSSNTPTSWNWSFGDGTYSTSQNPTHTYSTAGTYTVSLNATNAVGSNTETKAGYITVNKLTPTITWSNPSAITYGTALSSTQLNAASSVPGGFVYNPVSGIILGAGSQTLGTTFTPTDTTNYTTATKTATLAVNKATPTITWPNPSSITYGTALSSTQLNAAGSVAGTFVYTPASGSVLGAGSKTLSAAFTPTDSTNYTTTSKTATINVLKATPTITWSNPANITNLTALSSVQLNAAASVPGTFSYTPTAGTLLEEGTHTLNTTFTPTDSTNYTTVTKNVSIIVTGESQEPEPPEELNSSNYWIDGNNDVYVPVNISSGQSTTVYVYNESGYSPNGSLVFPVFYDEFDSFNSTRWSIKSSFGSNSVSNGIINVTGSTGNDNENYWIVADTGAEQNTTLLMRANLALARSYREISEAGLTNGVSLGSANLNDVLSFGTSSIDYCQSGDGSAYDLHSMTGQLGFGNWCDYEISRTATDTKYRLNGTYVYNSSTVSTGTWYPHINSRMSTASTLVDYMAIKQYTPTEPTVTINDMGSYKRVTINNTGSTNLLGYQVKLNGSQLGVTSRLDSLNVSTESSGESEPTVPTITWSNPADITYGTALSSSQLNAVASVPGTLTYTPASGTTLGAGTQTLRVDFVPTDTTSYENVSASVPLVVNKGTPTITWANPANITYGTALSSTQLNAASSIPGTFTYTPSIGTVLGAGTQTLSANLVPTDFSNYSIGTASASINVSKFQPVITWSTPNPITYGTALSSTQLNANSGGLSGSFVYDPIVGTVLGLGTHTLNVTFSPTDATNYTTKTASVQLVVNNLVTISNFTANNTLGNPPMTVQFTDLSTNTPTSWNYSFGDGAYSNLQNPTHTYSSTGLYSVRLNASNSGGYDILTKANYINVTSSIVPPVASFTSSVLSSGSRGTRMTFNDSSSGNVTSYAWDLDGNGITDRTTNNVTYWYTTPGRYNATLTVGNVIGNNTTTRTITIVKRRGIR
jgi:PKD repeat protein